MALSKVWVYAEADDAKPHSATLELLTKARQLGGTVEAVLVGGDADALADPLGSTAPPPSTRWIPAKRSPASWAPRRSSSWSAPTSPT